MDSPLNNSTRAFNSESQPPLISRKKGTIPQIKEEVIPNEVVSKISPLEDPGSPVKLLKSTGLAKSENNEQIDKVGVSTLLSDSASGSAKEISPSSIDNMTEKLNQALVTFKENKNVPEFESALQKANERMQPLLENLKDPALQPSIEKFQVKLKECEQNKIVEVTSAKIINHFVQSYKTRFSYLSPEEQKERGIKPPIPPRKKNIVAEVEKFTQSGLSAYSFRVVDSDALQLEKFAAEKGTETPALRKTFVITTIFPGKIPGMPVLLLINSQINRGGAGFIYSGVNVGEEKYSIVMKTSLPEKDWNYSRSIKALENEYSVLMDIHKDGKKIGVTPPPHTFVHGSTIGFLTDKQTMNGKQLGRKIPEGGIQITPMQKEKMVNDTVSGLETIHQLGYCHQDVKSDNLLWNEESKELLICDFGGVRKFSNLAALDHFPETLEIFGTHTSDYVSYDIYKSVENILEKFKPIYNSHSEPVDKEKLLKEMFKSEIEPLIVKNDRFALGLSLFETLTGTTPDQLLNTVSITKSRNEPNVFMPSFVSSNSVEQKINEKAELQQWTDRTKATIMTLLREGDVIS